MDHVTQSSAEFDVPAALAAPGIPDYMEETYHWAYINPAMVSWLDHELIVTAILWGNSKRLTQSALAEIEPGQRVLQAAYVYGNFTPTLARHIGPDGHVDVIDIVPLQVNNARRKLLKYPWAESRLADASQPGGGPYDTVCCYFLLHEVPDGKKHDVVNGLLKHVVPGGRVVFMDYHMPASKHPLKGLMNMVWRKLEPYAIGLTETEIQNLADEAGDFIWSKETYFGGLYQKVVAVRRLASENKVETGK